MSKAGYVYRRELPGGRMGKWHAVIDVPRGADGKRRQKTKSFDTESEAHAWMADMNDPSSAAFWPYAQANVGEDLRYTAKNIDKFFDNLWVSDTGCWLWTGSLSTYGYAQFYIGDGQKVQAHRWSYEYWTGEEIPPGMTIDHICHQPDSCSGGKKCLHRSCQNPDHLRVETPLENALRRSPNRGWAPDKRRTHCKRGHEFTEENTYWFGKNKSHRTCQICRTVRNGEAS